MCQEPSAGSAAEQVGGMSGSDPLFAFFPCLFDSGSFIFLISDLLAPVLFLHEYLQEEKFESN